jgi:hypothetical protein
MGRNFFLIGLDKIMIGNNMTIFLSFCTNRPFSIHNRHYSWVQANTQTLEKSHVFHFMHLVTNFLSNSTILNTNKDISLMMFFFHHPIWTNSPSDCVVVMSVFTSMHAHLVQWELSHMHGERELFIIYIHRCIHNIPTHCAHYESSWAPPLVHFVDGLVT